LASDQKEVKVRKSDQKEMKVKCLYEKEVTHEKKLIKNASFNSLDNTEVLYIKHKQEKKCHSSGQVDECSVDLDECSVDLDECSIDLDE
jgi:hypothetical protein